MDEEFRLTAKWALGKYHGEVGIPEGVKSVYGWGILCL